MRIQELFRVATTLIDVRHASGAAGSATGFFFSMLTAEFSHLVPTPEPPTVDSTWLVTNRHVLLRRNDNGTEDPAIGLTYRTRRLSSQEYRWIERPVSASELAERARFHVNRAVDNSVVDISPDAPQIELDGDDVGTMTDHQLLIGDNPIPVSIGTDVLVSGFPRGFYDDAHLFPTVKAGVVASGWPYPWRGEPRFLIDARLFQGSSGSMVTTKPTHSIDKLAGSIWSETGVMAVLGVYAGAPEHPEEKDGLDLGIVWYATLIPEIIREGLTFEQATVMRDSGTGDGV